jgi:hypothetical protein
MEPKDSTSSAVSQILSWVFGIGFIVIGILNLVLVHPVPGTFYLLFSLMYFPAISTLLKRKLGFSIPPIVKIALGFVLLWGTLAVGDLAEILGL